MATKKAETTETAAKGKPVFTREALATSKKYAAQRDAIMVALDGEREYTEEEAMAAVKACLETPVAEKINGKGDD